MQNVETLTRCGGMESAEGIRSRAPMNIGPPGICTMDSGHVPAGAAADAAPLAEGAPLGAAADPEASTFCLPRRKKNPAAAPPRRSGRTMRSTLGKGDAAGLCGEPIDVTACPVAPACGYDAGGPV